MSFFFLFFITFFLIVGFFDPQILSSLKSYIPIFLGLVMLGMGMTIEIRDIKNVFKNPKWIITGLFLQYTVMPILALSLSILFNLSPELTMGFIILGSCPGGTASNVIAYLSNANVPLSISMTLSSTILSIIFTPLLIFFLADKIIDIDLKGLFLSTFWIVVFPLIDGIILRKILENKVKFILIFLPKFSEISIALIIGIIFSLTHNILNEITLSFLCVMILHNLLGFYFGYIISGILRFPKEVRKTLALEIGMQNSGLGVSLSLLYFEKIVALPSAIFSLWHNLSAIVLFTSKKKTFTIINKFKFNKEKKWK